MIQVPCNVIANHLSSITLHPNSIICYTLPNQPVNFRSSNHLSQMLKLLGNETTKYFTLPHVQAIFKLNTWAACYFTILRLCKLLLEDFKAQVVIKYMLDNITM